MFLRRTLEAIDTPKEQAHKGNVEKIVNLKGVLKSPVLKINNHATGGWRTKDILGGPKSLETKELGDQKT